MHSLGRTFDWLTDWMTDWRTEWQTNWLTDWRTDGQTDRLTDFSLKERGVPFLNPLFKVTVTGQEANHRVNSSDNIVKQGVNAQHHGSAGAFYVLVKLPNSAYFLESEAWRLKFCISVWNWTLSFHLHSEIVLKPIMTHNRMIKKYICESYRWNKNLFF